MSWFYARPLPHIWSHTWWTGSFEAKLPSYFTFPIKLCFPSSNSLSEHVIWLNHQALMAFQCAKSMAWSRFATNPETQGETHSTNNKILQPREVVMDTSGSLLIRTDFQSTGSTSTCQISSIILIKFYSYTKIQSCWWENCTHAEWRASCQTARCFHLRLFPSLPAGGRGKRKQQCSRLGIPREQRVGGFWFYIIEY